jgi:hypothetical protein
MTLARVRLLAASTLLAAWIGWLGFQAWTRGRDYPVLSHSQFLVSTLDVIAEVRAAADGGPDPVVTLRRAHWPTGQDELAGRSITVANLPAARGYRGPGEYILPLIGGDGPQEYRVAGLPPSPGFETVPALYSIYPAGPKTLRQLAAIPKPSGSVDRDGGGEKSNPDR